MSTKVLTTERLMEKKGQLLDSCYQYRDRLWSTTQYVAQNDNISYSKAQKVINFGLSKSTLQHKKY